MQLIHFYGDDYQVLYPIHGNRNFFDILNYCLDKMNFFWYQWSGRIVGHFTVSFGLSLFGIQFFRIINPVMVFVMIFLSLKILQLIRDFDFTKYLFYISLIIIGCNIYISRETLYWAYSGILYIWGFNLTLFVIYFVYKYYLKNKKIPMFLKIILSICCILQAFTLETLIFITIAFLILMIIFCIKNKKNYSFLVILLLISITGFLISAFAPGNVLRVDPLKVELQGFNVLQIILGKVHGLFTMIFHPSIYGFYMGILLLLICKNYLKTTKRNFYYKIPLVIVLSYFIIIFIYKVFNINILLFFEIHNIDILQFYEYNSIYLILIHIYYVLLMGSIFFMIFKTTFKQNKFFFFSIVITFISTIIPVICIRYIGSRYYLFFLMNLILLIINYILDLKSLKISFIDIICIIIVSFSKYGILIMLFLFLLSFILFRNNKSFYNKSFNLVILCIFLSIIINLGVVFNGYKYNDKIYKENDKKLSDVSNLASDDFIIILSEIPYKYGLYSWHSNVLDFNNYHIYYGFYLNDFYSNYYGFDMNKVRVLAVNGNYY